MLNNVAKLIIFILLTIIFCPTISAEEILADDSAHEENGALKKTIMITIFFVAITMYVIFYIFTTPEETALVPILASSAVITETAAITEGIQSAVNLYINTIETTITTLAESAPITATTTERALQIIIKAINEESMSTTLLWIPLPLINPAYPSIFEVLMKTLIHIREAAPDNIKGVYTLISFAHLAIIDSLVLNLPLESLTANYGSGPLYDEVCFRCENIARIVLSNKDAPFPWELVSTVSPEEYVPLAFGEDITYDEVLIQLKDKLEIKIYVNEVILKLVKSFITEKNIEIFGNKEKLIYYGSYVIVGIVCVFVVAGVIRYFVDSAPVEGAKLMRETAVLASENNQSTINLQEITAEVIRVLKEEYLVANIIPAQLVNEAVTKAFAKVGEKITKIEDALDIITDAIKTD